MSASNQLITNEINKNFLSTLKEKLWTNMHGGKLVLFASKEDNVWDCLAESYKEEDIAKGLIKYFLP